MYTVCDVLFAFYQDAIQQKEEIQNTVTELITVTVIDIQDTPPQFISYPTIVTIDEQSPQVLYCKYSLANILYPASMYTFGQRFICKTVFGK